MDPDEIDNYGRSPLHHAAIANSIETTQILLEHNPKLNGADRFGLTPLLIAHINTNYDVMIDLIEAGAAIGTTKMDLEVLLLAAVEMGSVGATALLVREGANVLALDEYGRTALIAQRDGNREIVKALQSTKSVAFRLEENSSGEVDWKVMANTPLKPFRSRFAVLPKLET